MAAPAETLSATSASAVSLSRRIVIGPGLLNQPSLIIHLSLSSHSGSAPLNGPDTANCFTLIALINSLLEIFCRRSSAGSCCGIRSCCMVSLPPRISTLTLLNCKGASSLQGYAPWRSAVRLRAVNWLTTSPMRSDTGWRVPSCQVASLKRNGSTKSTPLIWLSGIQALPSLSTP